MPLHRWPILVLLFLVCGAWGAVSSEVARTDYTGNGSVAAYSTTFTCKATSELRVFKGAATTGADTELSLGADYSAVLNANGTVTITLTAGNLASGTKLSLQRGIPLTQTYNPAQSGAYSPVNLGAALDRLAMQVQRLDSEVDRAVRIPYLETGGSSTVLSAASVRASQLLGFDASGGLTLYDPTELGSGTGSGAAPNGVYDVTADGFDALGDGASHTLSASAAAAYNTAFSAYGAQGSNAIVAGDEQDFAAIQCALFKAATTGASIYVPPGTYRINRPLRLEWTATPDTGLPATPLVSRLYGAGRSSILMGYGIVAGRGVIEFLGESNTYAANIEISNLQVEQDAGCHKYSFCLRLGDGYAGVNLHRVICKGAQPLALRVASSITYAQICFSATQCQFWSNWDRRWGPDDSSMDVYAVVPESLGSYWDLAKFDSCFFWGQVDCRAFNLKFESCMFINQVERALPFGATVYLGTASWDNCYFEDHLVGIATDTSTAGVPITNIAIRNCHFSSVNNSGTPANAQSSILCARNQAEHGPVLIENCRFGGTATVADIDLYGPITVNVSGCCRPFSPGINTAPSINTAGDVRLIERNPNGELAFDVLKLTKVKIDADDFLGPATFTQNVAGGATVTMSNSDTGAASTAAFVATSNDVSVQMAAYHSTHGTLPGYGVLFHNHATAPIAIAPTGLPRLLVDHTWVLANQSVNGGYGFGAQNTNVGANAVAFNYVTNGTDFAVFQTYGTGHALAGQAFLGTSTNDKMNFGANGLFEMTIDPADRRVKMRGNGIVGGLWYIQTTTPLVENTTTETSITTGGAGTLTIPANTLQVGSALELCALVTEQAAGAVTYTYRFYAGAAAFASPVATYGGVSAQAAHEMKVQMTVKTLGATGTWSYTTYRDGVPVGFGTTVIDTTASLLIYLSADPSVADPSNIVTCPQAHLKVTL
jgi:hypothetical protein